MKRLLCAVAISASLTGAAIADERQDAINTIARVLAFQKLCPRIEMDTEGPVLPLMAAYGIDFDIDAGEVLPEARRQIASWAGKSEEAACATALTLYGPKGINAAGLLKEK